MVTRSFKYRLYPNTEQQTELRRQMTCHRWLYNAALQQRANEWRMHKRKVTRFDQSKEVKLVKRECPEFVAISSHSLGQTLGRLDKAFAAFFARVKRGEFGGYPQFRSERTFRTIDFYMQGGGGSLKSINGKTYLYLHGVGYVKVRWHRPLPEGCILKQAVVSWAPSGKWHVCFQLQRPDFAPDPHSGLTVGMDVGVYELVLTNGSTYQQARALEKAQRKLRIVQRTMDRRKPIPGQPGSKGYMRAKLAFAKAHESVANTRKDLLHKISRDLVTKYGTLAIEDLNLKPMLRRTDKPAHGREHDEWLNRNGHDAAWGQLKLFLDYKADEVGCRLVKVDPAHTTRDCNRCDWRSPVAVTARNFVCEQCGCRDYRKDNAAANILERASV